MDKIKEWWTIPAVQRATISILVVLIALIVYLVVRRIRHAYVKKKGIDGRRGAASSLKSVIYDTIKVSIVTILVLTILQINGVNVTSLVAGVGVASAVIGLSLQDFLKDIIMGVHILMDDFYQIGDLVQYGDDEGVVEEFNLRTTKIRSINDGDLITLCNRNVLDITKSSPEVYIHQPLPYGLSLGRATEVLNRIAEKTKAHEEIADCTFLGTTNFDNSSVDYLLKVVCEKADTKLRCRRIALMEIQETLAEEHIQIPFDQVDVHMIPQVIEKK